MRQANYAGKPKKSSSSAILGRPFRCETGIMTAAKTGALLHSLFMVVFILCVAISSTAVSSEMSGSVLPMDSTSRESVVGSIGTQAVLRCGSEVIESGLERQYGTRPHIMIVNGRRLADPEYRSSLSRTYNIALETGPVGSKGAAYVYSMFQQMPHHEFLLMDAALELPWAYDRLIPQGLMMRIARDKVPGDPSLWDATETRWLIVVLGGIDGAESHAFFATWRHVMARSYMAKQLWPEAERAMRDSILLANGSVTYDQILDLVFVLLRRGDERSARAAAAAFRAFQKEDGEKLQRYIDETIKERATSLPAAGADAREERRR